MHLFKPRGFFSATISRTSDDTEKYQDHHRDTSMDMLMFNTFSGFNHLVQYNQYILIFGTYGLNQMA